ncbi:putative inorganic phosphate cotransporter isoform X2 [Copidosoma floridanum]|uniref:putative inorganic phosphate cotransporter isoform X2 n=1 Tax=Copidosoma floridanum TaxID=29053 RepID=UPI0006C98B51|nr:putative inorganic phosphate cotransporter isoform X2 [Copidosoma floridanum]
MLDNVVKAGIMDRKPRFESKAPQNFEAEVPPPQGWWGKRHMVTAMLFLGMANAYVMRTNMSVAIVAMVNHTAIFNPNETTPYSEECTVNATNDDDDSHETDGEYVWNSKMQGYLLSSFFYGYVITQIPFGILAKRFGSKYFLGVGMLINSLFGLLVPLSAQKGGFFPLMLVRFIQGLGEGPIVPCTHAMLAKWIPPNERSRMGAFVYAGAQFGTVISMPLSGLLSKYGFADGWPSIFYVFGTIGTIWCIAFLFMVSEDPESDPNIKDDERKYIISSLWGTAGASSPPVPWKSIFTSMPFYAILLAHMGHNYGYETLMTELPTYMKQILRFKIASNGTVSALPYLAMWIFSMFISHVADWMISKKHISHSITRKVINSIGQYCPAIALVAASYTGCNPTLTVFLLTVGVGLNGGIYSGFKVNHLDISPRFAGVLMSFTNCLANLAGLLAPITAGYIIHDQPSQANWRIVFLLCAVVYVFCATFYIIFASGERQSWDDPQKDKAISDKKLKKQQQQKQLQGIKTINETRH